MVFGTGRMTQREARALMQRIVRDWPALGRNGVDVNMTGWDDRGPIKIGVSNLAEATPELMRRYSAEVAAGLVVFQHEEPAVAL